MTSPMHLKRNQSRKTLYSMVSSCPASTSIRTACARPYPPRVMNGLPIPALCNAVSYLDEFRGGRRQSDPGPATALEPIPMREQTAKAYSTMNGGGLMTISTNLTIFGGTGDLTFRKLLPALYTMDITGKLPEDSRSPSLAAGTTTAAITVRLPGTGWRNSPGSFEEKAFNRFLKNRLLPDGFLPFGSISWTESLLQGK